MLYAICRLRISRCFMPPPPLVMQTTYAELLERCGSAAFGTSFPAAGTFTSKTIRNRRYWYFQLPSEEGRTQRYVGPETPELLERISHHKEARDDERERRALVSTLVRSFGLSRPIAEIGNIVAALAKAGIFRLRGVLVGTVACQTYSAMLGIKLPHSILQTGDIDIAQFRNVSVAVSDTTPPVLDVLREVDSTFRAVPHISDGRRSTSYSAKGGLRVDFLTPNEGPDTDAPQALPAFRTDAQPLRFLDYLIHEPEAAVVLHGAGIYVLVPAPERYAVHKLIVARRRREGAAKRDKDLQQAEALLGALVLKRPHDLWAAWEEAYARGQTWQKLLLEGLSQLAPDTRDGTLKIINLPRKALPAVELTFKDPRPYYDFGRDVVVFPGEDNGRAIQCAVSREALDDHFDANGLSAEKRVEKVVANRSAIEGLARVKYLSWPVEEPAMVLIKTGQVAKLLEELRTTDAEAPQKATK
jgi:hypothetical protein